MRSILATTGDCDDVVHVPGLPALVLEHTRRVCTECKERRVESTRSDVLICQACWYAEQHTEALKRFGDLDDALRAEGVATSRIELWQTGGMVFCFAIVGARTARTAHASPSASNVQPFSSDAKTTARAIVRALRDAGCDVGEEVPS